MDSLKIIFLDRNGLYSFFFLLFLYTWVRASWNEFNNCPTRCDLFSLLHFCRQLYMFRVLTPIIRSSYNCNYSFWYRLTGSTTIRSRCWVGTDSCVSYDTHESVPDDGCQHLKHVGLPTESNKLNKSHLVGQLLNWVTQHNSLHCRFDCPVKSIFIQTFDTFSHILGRVSITQNSDSY